jgi:hypothetical protein
VEVQVLSSEIFSKKYKRYCGKKLANLDKIRENEEIKKI